MSTLTATLITLNEERHLRELLPRLAWADEVVVMDGGSTDATAEIARRQGCRVAAHPFDTFARQRNRAIDLAGGDWVLSIDADERPTAAIVKEIRRCIASRRCNAFRVPIRSRIFGRRFRFSGTQDDRPVRLFRRGAARWHGDVHEVLSIAGRIGHLRCWLEHETLPDLPAFLRKMDRYTSLAAAGRAAAGMPPHYRDRWLKPCIEAARRLVWKRGLLDGPEGWAFCALSGLSEWVLANKHRKCWRQLQGTGG